MTILWQTCVDNLPANVVYNRRMNRSSANPFVEFYVNENTGHVNKKFLLSCLSELLHRTILLSGSGLSPWAMQRDPLFVKRRVAEHTGCHGDLLEDDLAPCLRLKPLSQLLSVSINAKCKCENKELIEIN